MPNLPDGPVDFWRVYDEHYDEVFDAVLQAAAAHPEFGPVVSSADPEAVQRERRARRGELREVFQGDPRRHEARLRQEGITYASSGVSLPGWYDLAAAFTAPLVPLILQTYQHDAPRLNAALIALHEHLGWVLSTVGEGYLLGTERLRKGERMFRGLLESAPDAIVITDQAGRIRLVNAQAERLFGYTRDELIGELVELLIPERFRSGHMAHRTEYTAEPRTRAMGSGLELHGRRKDGSEFPLEISLSPLRTDDDGLLVSSAIRDISERKTAERAKSEAARRIEELADALTRRATELEVVNRELESFSYSVSHDLRTPLRALDGFSQILLAKYLDRPLDEKGRDYLQRIRRASQRMGRLIDDLLTLSRLSRVEMKRRPFDLGKLATTVANELAEEQPERQVVFTIAPKLRAEVDPQLFEVALRNLIGNAWKFTSKRPEAHIEVGLCDVDGEQTYFVRDDGAGFDMAYAGQLFGAFQRLHSSNDFEGTGVGLATVQRVIVRHGGRVWAEAAPDRGATFYFTLPGSAPADDLPPQERN